MNTPNNCFCISAASDGYAWTANSDGVFFYSQSNGWSPAPKPNQFDDSFQLAATSHGLVYGLGTDGIIQVYDGTRWSAFAKQPSALAKNIACGGNDCLLIQDINNLYSVLLNGQGATAWISVELQMDSTNLVGMSVTTIATYESFACLFFFDDYKIITYIGGEMVALPLIPGDPAIAVSMGEGANIIAINESSIYLYMPDAEESTETSSWYYIGPSMDFTAISVGSIKAAWGLKAGTPTSLARYSNSGFKWYINDMEVYDTNANTHLWLVYQAATLADKARGVYENAGKKVFSLIFPTFGQTAPIDDKPFHNGLCQGLYDADFLPEFNDETISGVSLSATYKSHFYDPDTNKNFRGADSPTARSSGLKYYKDSISYYFNTSLSDTDKLYKSGYSLGLALHYFTDLTQPMHAANYTVLSSFPWGFHTDFESEALSIQNLIPIPSIFTSRLLTDNLDANDFFINTARYFKPYSASIVGDCLTNWVIQDRLWRPKADNYIKDILNKAISIIAEFIVKWHIDLYNTYPDWHVVRATQTETFNGCFGGLIQKGLTSAAGGVNLFALDNKGSVWVSAYHNGWYPFSEALGKPQDTYIKTTMQPLSSSTGDVNSYVFGIGNDKKLWQRRFDGYSWQDWTNLGNPPNSVEIVKSLSTASFTDNYQQGALVIGLGSDKNVWSYGPLNGNAMWNCAETLPSMHPIETAGYNNSYLFIVGGGKLWRIFFRKNQWDVWDRIEPPKLKTIKHAIGTSGNFTGLIATDYSIWVCQTRSLVWTQIPNLPDNVLVSSSVGILSNGSNYSLYVIGDDNNLYRGICNNKRWLGWDNLKQPNPANIKFIAGIFPIDSISTACFVGNDNQTWVRPLS